MHKKKRNIVLTFALALAGCTSVNTLPVSDFRHLKEVCIIKNDRVLVSDFVDVIQAHLDKHNARSRLVNEAEGRNCATQLSYTATRSWDFAPYLSYASIQIRREGKLISKGEYRHHGGLSLMKWQSTEAKIGPVLDKMLTVKNPHH